MTDDKGNGASPVAAPASTAPASTAPTSTAPTSTAPTSTAIEAIGANPSGNIDLNPEALPLLLQVHPDAVEELLKGDAFQNYKNLDPDRLKALASNPKSANDTTRPLRPLVDEALEGLNFDWSEKSGNSDFWQAVYKRFKFTMVLIAAVIWAVLSTAALLNAMALDRVLQLNLAAADVFGETLSALITYSAVLVPTCLALFILIGLLWLAVNPDRLAMLWLRSRVGYEADRHALFDRLISDDTLQKVNVDVPPKADLQQLILEFCRRHQLDLQIAYHRWKITSDNKKQERQDDIDREQQHLRARRNRLFVGVVTVFAATVVFSLIGLGAATENGLDLPTWLPLSLLHEMAAVGLWLEAHFGGAIALLFANIILTYLLFSDAKSRIYYDQVAHRLSERTLLELQDLRSTRLAKARSAAQAGNWDEVKSFIQAMQHIIKDEHKQWKTAKAVKKAS